MTLILILSEQGFEVSYVGWDVYSVDTRSGTDRAVRALLQITVFRDSIISDTGMFEIFKDR